MKKIFLWKHLLASICLLFLSTNILRAQQTVVVTAANVAATQADISASKPWFTNDTRPGGTVSFVNGPAPTPLGCGSLQLHSTDANGGSGNAKAQLFNYSFIGTKLSDINQMSFWAYRSSTSTNNLAQTITLNIEIDFVGDGSSFTTLNFEPVYQAGGVGAMQLNTWQKWDAYNGGNAIWWTHHAIPGVCADNCFVTWNAILAANPNAKISGGVGLDIGSGWTGQYTGSADAFTFGTAANATTFNFEQVPNNVVNTNTGRTYCSIQAAINDPLTVNGNTIAVGAGTYNENVTVNKELNIKGANYGFPCSGERTAESVVNGTTPGNIATFIVQSDNVIIDGFTITDAGGSYGVSANHVNHLTISDNIITNIGTSNGSGNHDGIYFEIGSAVPSSNLSISNNCINNVGGPVSNAGILIGTSGSTQVLTGVNISQNKIDHIQSTTKGAYGITVNPHPASSASNLVVQNNEISNLNGSWAHGIGLEGNTPGALVTNNAFSAFTSAGSDNFGVTLQDNTNVSTVQINQNSFLNSGFAIGNNPGQGTVNATCNWYGSTDGSVIAGKTNPPGSGPVTYTPWLSNGTDSDPATGFQSVPNSCSGGTHVHNITQNTHFVTIQPAINAANPGDVIVVDPGTYNESVTVNKVITLKGSGSGNDPSSNSILTSTLTLTASGTDVSHQVNIQNFDIATSPSAKGVYANGSFTTLSNLVVEGNTYGVELASALTDFTLTLCNIKNNGTGIRMGTTIDVNRLTMTNCNVDNNQYGLYNEKAAPTLSVPSTSNLNNLTVTNTTFINNGEKGIYFEKLNNAVFNHIIVNSSGNHTTNQAVGIDLNLKYGNYQNIQFLNSTISDNGKNNPNGGGIFIKARASGSYGPFPATLDNVVLNNDVVTGNGSSGNFSAGIRIGDANGSFIGTDPGPTNVQIHSSTISGNQVNGLTNATSSQTLVDATCNWWGNASGPTVASNPGGSGDVISGNVLFTPWSISTDPNSCLGGPKPKLTTTVNNVVLTDGSVENDALSVCNSAAQNLSFKDIKDLNNSMPADKVMVIQQFERTNVSFGPNDGTFPLSAFAGSFDRNVSLVDPATQGTLVMHFRAFFDANGNNMLDPGESAGDLLTYTVTVNPVPVTGPISGTTSVCLGSNNGHVSLDPAQVVGSVSRWEYSTDNGMTWNTINNTGFSQSYGNLVQTTWYRAVVQSGVCDPVNSDAAVITVNPVPTWYLDADGDGHASQTTTSCSSPGTGWTTTVLPVDDCNDNDANVNAQPKLSTTINNVTVNSNNDGQPDQASFSVCNTPNNILFGPFTDQNGNTGTSVKAYQVIETNNVSVPFCNNCTGAITLFAGTPGTASLINPTMPGTLVMRFTEFIDKNGNGIMDGDECRGDEVVYTVTVTPQLTWYLDNDGDGHASQTTMACSSPGAHWTTTVLPVGDCDDTNPNVWRNGTFYVDHDGDGFTVGNGVTLCYGTSTPVGYSATKSAIDDCNDNDAGVHNQPILSSTINGVTINSNNDGQPDRGSFTVCSMPGNLSFGTFKDLNGNSGPLVKAYQTTQLNNVVTSICTNCSAPVNVFAGSPPHSVTLVNPDMPGTLTITYREWFDNNNNGVIDPGECSGDYVIYTVTVTPQPTWYLDNDGDGHASQTTRACSSPGAHWTTTVLPVDDCNDSDPTVYSSQVYYRDVDGDGLGDPYNSIQTCQSTPPQGYVTNNYDCDDTKLEKNPGDNQVLMCHNGKQECVPSKDVQKHLDEKNSTWSLGPCTQSDCGPDQTIMCHDGKEECVPNKDVQKHLGEPGNHWALGSCTSPCGPDKTLMCHDGNNECVPTKDVAKHLAEPGNHWAQGFCTSPCGSDKTLMCHDGKEECIPTKDVAKHLAEPGNHWATGFCAGSSTVTFRMEYTDISDKPSLVPQQYSLSNYPNPFAGTSTIKYDLPYDSKVSIKVYDVMGREITTLVNNEDKKAGSYSVEFNGSKFSRGSLFYRIIAKSKDKQFEQTNKMIQLQ